MKETQTNKNVKDENLTKELNFFFRNLSSADYPLYHTPQRLKLLPKNWIFQENPTIL